MPKLERQIHYRMGGSRGEDEEWFNLVLDTDAKRLYVEREHDYVDAYKGGKAHRGTQTFSVDEFLQGSWKGQPEAKLLDLLATLFEKK